MGQTFGQSGVLGFAGIPVGEHDYGALGFTFCGEILGVDDVVGSVWSVYARTETQNAVAEMKFRGGIVSKEFVAGGDGSAVKLNQILKFGGTFGLLGGGDGPIAGEIESPLKGTNHAVGCSETETLLPFCHPVRVDGLHTLGDRAFHGRGSSPIFYLEASEFPRVRDKS